MTYATTEDGRAQLGISRSPDIGGTLIIALLCGILATLLYVAASSSLPAKWEYSVVDIKDSNFEKDMARIGDGGWEVVSARRASNGDTRDPTFSYELIFKRPQSLFNRQDPRP